MRRWSRWAGGTVNRLLTLGHKGESLPSNQAHTHTPPLTDQQLSGRVHPKEILRQGDLYEDVHCGTVMVMKSGRASLPSATHCGACSRQKPL